MTVFCEGNCGKEFRVPDALEAQTTIICICLDCYKNAAYILKQLIKQIQALQ